MKEEIAPKHANQNNKSQDGRNDANLACKLNELLTAKNPEALVKKRQVYQDEAHNMLKWPYNEAQTKFYHHVGEDWGQQYKQTGNKALFQVSTF